MPRSFDKTKDLERSEWLFEEVSDRETEICYKYEFARECPDIRLWKCFTDPDRWIAETAIPAEFARRELRRDIGFIRLAWIDLGFLMRIPEWPETPWQSIPADARKRYLPEVKDGLWSAWHKAGKRKNHKQTVDPLCLSLLNCVSGKPMFGAYRNPERFERHEIVVDWSMTDQSLADEFRLWLAQHREKEPTQSAPKLKSRLQYLGLYRLVKAMPPSDAKEVIARHCGTGHRLFHHPRWDRARATVREVLKEEFLNAEKVLRNSARKPT